MASAQSGCGSRLDPWSRGYILVLLGGILGKRLRLDGKFLLGFFVALGVAELFEVFVCGCGGGGVCEIAQGGAFHFVLFDRRAFRLSFGTGLFG